MDSSPRTLIHQLLALRLHTDATLIRDTDRFDDLGLITLDLVLVVVQLGRFDPGDREFPLHALEDATTVGDLVDLIELWSQRDTTHLSAA